MKNAARLITLACIIQILGYAYALPGHLDEPSWSQHAQFHHVLGWIWLVGLNIAIVALVWGPLQKKDRLSFGFYSSYSFQLREATSAPPWLFPQVALPNGGMTMH